MNKLEARHREAMWHLIKQLPPVKCSYCRQISAADGLACSNCGAPLAFIRPETDNDSK